VSGETVHQNSKALSIIYNFALKFEGVYCDHFLLRLLGILLRMVIDDIEQWGDLDGVEFRLDNCL